MLLFLPGYSTYLETSKDHRALAQRQAFACQRNYSIFDRVSGFPHASICLYSFESTIFYNSCGESTRFDVYCKKDGLVTARNDEVRLEFRDLLAHVFSLFRVQCDPVISLPR